MQSRVIEVECIRDGDPLEFEVRIREARGESRHEVTMSMRVADRLQHRPEQCVEAAFRFLLDREPKKSILRRFDISVISRYFPDFEQALPRYFDPV